jgi:hypothetical protein
VWTVWSSRTPGCVETTLRVPSRGCTQLS